QPSGELLTGLERRSPLAPVCCSPKDQGKASTSVNAVLQRPQRTKRWTCLADCCKISLLLLSETFEPLPRIGEKVMTRMGSLAVALLSLTGLCFADGSGLWLMRHPTLSKTHVVFSYAGDLWIASREGGDATRLTTGVGNESSPLFSPDGKLVAFTGEYDGNIDVYTVPVTGGVPKRLTYHPGADSLAGWTPDGKQVLFVSQRNSSSGRFARLFTLAVDGVFPTEVPLPMAYEGAYSPDGKRLAYT